MLGAAPALPATAQAPAATDIYVLALTLRGGQVELGRPRNVTARVGYDNQPTFTPDGAQLLYTSARDGQADSYAYDLASGRTVRLTTTAVSEYSPTVTPDGAAISVVVVEPDSTQRLWRFPRGGGAAALVLRDVRPVGYHAWADSSTLVLFVLGSGGTPATLQVADVRTGRAEVVASAPHRSLQRMADGRVSVVLRDADSTRWLAAVDARTRRIERLVRAPDGGGEYDHAWLPDGSALMAGGGPVYRWAPGTSTWTRVATFPASLRTPTRLAVSPRGDWLAVVAEEPGGTP